jgi:hypothetical protein
MLRFDGRIEAVDVGQICGVRLYRHRAMPDVRHRFVEFGLSTAGDDDMGPFPGEGLCDAQADSCAATGHDRDLAIQSTAQESYPSVALSRGARRGGGCDGFEIEDRWNCQ